MATQELIKKLEKTIDNIPNFPKEGIQFKDITPIFLNPELYEEVIDDLVAFSKGKVDVVCGIESRASFWNSCGGKVRSSFCVNS